MSLNERKETYKQIHIAANKLKLNETARRNVYDLLVGQRTLVDMRPTELATVADFFKEQTTPKFTPHYVSDEEALAVLG